MDLNDLQLISLKNQVDQNTASLVEMTYDAKTSNILVLSESILGAGNFVTQFKNKFSSQPNTIESIYGGNHISIALAEMADEVYSLQVGENAVKYSNDFTKSAWALNSTISLSRDYLEDGTIWNKLTKADNTDNRGVYYGGLTYPSGATGIYVSFEVYTKDVSNIMTSIEVALENNTTGTGHLYYTPDAFEKGKITRVAKHYSPSEISWTPGVGDTLTLNFRLNKNATPVSSGACIAYIRNVELSFFAPTGYQRYIPTLGSAVAAGTATMDRADISKFEYNRVDATIVSFGRNEANYGVSPTSHYRAYDKLISKCMEFGTSIVIGNPPPHKDATLDAWATDSYYINYLNVYKKLMSKWNCGVDINSLFRNLVSSGQYTPAQLMADEWHQNATGSAKVAEEYYNALTKRKIINNAKSELKNNIKYYLRGEPTGSWTAETAPSGVERRLIGRNTCIKSSTANDYLLFNNIYFEQLHLVYRTGGNGAFSVIVDEGTGRERTYVITATSGTELISGMFIGDNFSSDAHTVKIKVTNSGTPVKIHGIVAI